MRVSAAGAGCVCSVMWGVKSVRHRKAVGWLRDLVGAMRSGGCGSNADWGGVAWPAAGQVWSRRVGKAVECASDNLLGMRGMERGCAEALGVPSAGTLPVRRPPFSAPHAPAAARASRGPPARGPSQAPAPARQPRGSPVAPPCGTPAHIILGAGELVLAGRRALP